MSGIYDISRRFSTPKKCYAYLEKLRWNGTPVCPDCASSSVTKRKNQQRYHCNGCGIDFSVLNGTIFEDTRLPLPQWFILIRLVLNARKGISSMQLSRDLKVGYPTAWYAAMRLRCAMIETVHKLDQVVEMDESYIGGKPRKRNVRIADNVAAFSNVYTKVKRGRGADKIKVVGVVQRGKNGRVYTKIMEQLTARNLIAMLKRYVDTDKGKSVIATDEFKSYKQFNKILPHFTVNHSKGEYVRNNVHTNTIEGYWSIIKNGIRGQYHALSKKYLPFYLAEFAYKYNRRDQKDTFEETVKRGVCLDKCMIYYKPKRKPNLLTNFRGKQKGSCSLGDVGDYSQEGLDLYTHLMVEEIKSLSKAGLEYLENGGLEELNQMPKIKSENLGVHKTDEGFVIMLPPTRTRKR